MTERVPQLSIIFMAVSCVAAFVIPVVLAGWLRRHKGASLKPFAAGALVMMLFAFVLESLVHRKVLATQTGALIQSNVWLYALYGGLMAGLFEECGRYIACRYVIKDCASNDANALMYGAGHGGFECMALLGVTMINNIAISMSINSGSTAVLTEGLSGDALLQAEAIIRSFTDTPPYLFLAGLFERISALILQLSLSVMVWFSVNRGARIKYLIMAILIHAFADIIGALLSATGGSIAVTEIAIFAVALISVYAARRIWNIETYALRKSLDKAA